MSPTAAQENGPGAGQATPTNPTNPAKLASTAIAVFLRPVVPGATKTRLTGLLGAAGAAALYRAFLRDTLTMIAQVVAQERARGRRIEPTLWVAGDPQHPSLAEFAESFPDWQRSRQPERAPRPTGEGLPARAAAAADLGVRQEVALRSGLTGCERALVIGTDLPTLPGGHLQAALAALDRQPSVVGPSADGGYYLLGLRRCPEGLLSGIRWSSPHTLSDTCARLAAHGLAGATLPPHYDVDEPADLRTLATHLALTPAAAPHTAEQLRSWAGKRHDGLDADA